MNNDLTFFQAVKLSHWHGKNATRVTIEEQDNGLYSIIKL